MVASGPVELAEALGSLREPQPDLAAVEQPRLARLGERHPRAYEQRLHRRERRAHRLGDLVVGEIVDLAQHERSPLRLWQLADVGEDRPHLLAALHALECPGAVRLVDVHRVLPLGDRPPKVVQAAVPGDAVEPRPHVDGPRVGQHRRVRVDEDLLEHVLGILRRAQHVPAEGQEARLVAVHESLEGSVVAAPYERDELLVPLKPQER